MPPRAEKPHILSFVIIHGDQLSFRPNPLVAVDALTHLFPPLLQYYTTVFGEVLSSPSSRGILGITRVKESTKEEGMACFVKELIKNGAMTIVVGDGRIKRYDDLLANVRYDGKYHSIRSLVQPDDPDVREVARVLLQAPDFISAAQELVNSFTTYGSEVGDFWRTPAETLAKRTGVDCVTGDTPVWVKIKGLPKIVEIQELAIGDYCIYGGVGILTPTGFAPLLSIRRKRARPVLNILGTSVIGITSEHKLLLNPNIHGCDRYCAVGDIKLDQLVKNYPKLTYSDSGDYEIGWAYGLFFADGTVHVRPKITMGGEEWRIVNANTSYLERAGATFAKLYPEFVFTINEFNSYGLHQLTNFGPRKHALYCLDAQLHINDSSGTRGRMVREFYKLIYNSRGVKKVPEFILMGDSETARGFWDGAFAGDGNKYSNKYSKKPGHLTSKSKLATLGLATLIRKMGKAPSIGRDHKSYWIHASDSPGPKSIWRVEAGKEELFDIATANGEFVAGDVAAKNCDDSSILLTSILRAGGIPPDQVYGAFGLWTLDGETDGHMWVVLGSNSGEDRTLESTASPWKHTRGKYIIHGIFNDQYTFSTGVGLKEFDLKVVRSREYEYAK